MKRASLFLLVVPVGLGGLSCGEPNEVVATTAVEAPLTVASPDASAPTSEAPSDTMVVPSIGKVPRGCVHDMPQGTTIDADGTERLHGKVVSHEGCKVLGESLSHAGTAKPGITIPQAQNWVMDSQMSVTTLNGRARFTLVQGTYTVPPDPIGNDNQILYYFIGASGFSDAVTQVILQPVLMWGNGGGFGGRQWTLVGWYAQTHNGTPSGSHSTPVRVFAGDTITASVRATANAGFTNPWTVTLTDTTPGHQVSTSKAFSTPSGLAANIAEGGVLEAYNRFVNGPPFACHDYPDVPMVVSNLQVGQQSTADRTSVQLVTPNFHEQLSFTDGQPMDCGYGVEIINGTTATTALDTCAHDPCLVGGTLKPACNVCVEIVCNLNPFCCESGWDQLCTSENRDVCGSCAPSANFSTVDFGGGCIATATQCTVNDVNGANPTRMHCCPGGSGMNGYFATSDSFQCLPVTFDQGNTSFQNRTNCHWRGTTRSVTGTNYLACSVGEYMIGYQASSGRIACCPYGENVTERVDGDEPGEPTPSIAWPVGSSDCSSVASMHQCQTAEMMTGLNGQANRFLCSKP